MTNQRHSKMQTHERPSIHKLSRFMKDESANSTVAFTIGGVTITIGGALAFLTFGALMSGLRSVPEVGGSFATVGVLVLIGCLTFFVMALAKEWRS